MNPDVLKISLGDVHVGTMFRGDGDKSWFVFTDEYKSMKNRPVLSQSFLSADLDLVTQNKPRLMKVDPFFSNLLPEGALRDFLSEANHINKEREFVMLKTLGADLSGAVVVGEANGEVPDIAEPELFSHSDLEDQNSLKFSLAGVQLKFSAQREMGKGFVIPAKGRGGEWIVKLPDFRFKGVPENEYSMMQMAKSIGIDVPQIELIDINKIVGIPRQYESIDGQAFAVKRFDRDGTERIHIEDFAQIFGVYAVNKYDKANYANIGHVLKTRVGSVAVEEFVRRVAFSVAIGNGDMHVKNWSLIYEDGINPSLAPAYDFVSTLSYIPNGSFALNLGGTKNYADIGVETWEKFADEIAMPKDWVVNIVHDTFARTKEAIEKMRSSLPAGEKVWEGIDHRTQNLLL